MEEQITLRRFMEPTFDDYHEQIRNYHKIPAMHKS